MTGIRSTREPQHCQSVRCQPTASAGTRTIVGSHLVDIGGIAVSVEEKLGRVLRADLLAHPSARGHQVFISHAYSDAKFASALVDLLGDVFSGLLKAFVSSDPSPTGGILPGEEWYARIHEQLQACEAVWVIATPTSITRPWLYWEAGLGKAVCPSGIVVVSLAGLSTRTTSRWRRVLAHARLRHQPHVAAVPPRPAVAGLVTCCRHGSRRIPRGTALVPQDCHPAPRNPRACRMRAVEQRARAAAAARPDRAATRPDRTERDDRATDLRAGQSPPRRTRPRASRARSPHR